MSAERPWYIKTGRTTLCVEVIGIVDRCKEAIPAQTRGINGADRLAECESPLQTKGLTEAVQNRKRTAVVVSPAAIVTVRDASEEVVRSKACSRACHRVETPDAAITLCAHVFMNASCSQVVGLTHP